MAKTHPDKLPPLHKRKPSSLTQEERLVRERIINRKLDEELLSEIDVIPAGTLERGATATTNNPTPPGVDRNGDGTTYAGTEKREHGDLVVQELIEAPRSRGRPPRILTDKDLRQLDSLAAIQCTYEEIAGVLEVDAGWLSKQFSDRIEEKRQQGMASLRRRQFQKAIVQEDTIMQIFLGKNVLGQSDKKDVAHTGADGGPIRHSHAHVHTTWNIGGRDLNFRE